MIGGSPARAGIINIFPKFPLSIPMAARMARKAGDSLALLPIPEQASQSESAARR